MSSATHNPLLKAARNPSCSIAAPTVATRKLTTNKPTKGFDTSSIQPPGPSRQLDLSLVHVTHNVLAQLGDSPVQLPMVPDSEPLRSPSHDMDAIDLAPTFISDPGLSTAAASHDAIMRTLVHHRMTADVTRAQPDPRPTKIRKTRTCAKCACAGCSGSQKSSNCRNACQDCKLKSCRGRNAKKPKKICSTPGLWDKH